MYQYKKNSRIINNNNDGVSFVKSSRYKPNHEITIILNPKDLNTLSAASSKNRRSYNRKRRSVDFELDVSSCSKFM